MVLTTAKEIRDLQNKLHNIDVDGKVNKILNKIKEHIKKSSSRFITITMPLMSSDVNSKLKELGFYVGFKGKSTLVCGLFDYEISWVL